jgi:hypothetical protein
VKVTAKYGDGLLQLGGEVAGCVDDGFAEVSHDGAGGAEASSGGAQLGQNGVGVLGGNLPGPQDPTAPACVDDEEGALPVFAGGIDV